ncbi:hypothetical protein E0K89_016385 [Aquicoccus sp. SCR17]|nr:hypothetical protein [Carideicomes alvinocaridis]
MTIQDFFLRRPAMAELLAEIRRCGMVIELGFDFAHLREVLLENKGQEISPPFDIRQHNLSEDNAFWIIGRTLDGEIAHTQAVRFFDMTRMALGEYMEEHFRDFPPVGVDLDMERSRYRAGPGARRIRGRVCYHGEMWLDEQRGQFRGKGMAGMLTQLGFMITMERMSPDYVFAFMAAPVATKGLPQRAGFMHTEPGSLTWRLANSERAFEGFLAYNSAEDIHYLLRLGLDRTA